MADKINYGLTRFQRYYRKHREQERAEWKQWYEKNKEHVSAKNKERYAADPEAGRNRIKQWRKDNPDKVREQKQRNWPGYYERHKEQVHMRKIDWTRQLKEEVIQEYGGKCACCGEDTYEFLTIDHIHGGGAEHKRQMKAAGIGQNLYRWLKKNGYPKEDFQLLCMNCNFAKGKYGTCPHVRAELSIVQGMAC